MLAFQTPWQIAGILSSVKVDVVILGEMLEMIYEDLERQGEAMTFENPDCIQMPVQMWLQSIIEIWFGSRTFQLRAEKVCQSSYARIHNL